MAVKIHPSAIVHPSAILDENVEIGPHVVIGESVQIGSDTYVGPHCVVEFARIGKGNCFTASAFVGTAPQDWSYKGEPTRLIMGDHNVIREGVTLHRGTSATHETIIGSRCMFMVGAHVGHDGRVGDSVVMVNCATLGGHVHVGDRANISGLSAVHQFTRVGRLAMVGGGAMVVKDVVPFCRAQGDRAQLVGINIIGLKRSGMCLDAIHAVRQAYRVIFLSGNRLEVALNILRTETSCPEVHEMVAFCEKSKRGIARPRMIGGKAVLSTDVDPDGMV